MTSQIAQDLTLHRWRLRITPWIAFLFLGLIFWPELRATAQPFPGVEYTLGVIAQSAQRPAGSLSATKSEQDIRVLEPSAPREGQLAGGQTHDYHLNLAAGQFLHVVVDQRGIDVVVRLFAPDGKQLIEVDSPNGDQ